MQYLIFVAIISAATMTFLFFQRLTEVRAMPEEVFLRRFELEEKSFSDLHHFFVTPVAVFFKKNIFPIFILIREKIIYEVRKVAVRLGKALLRFDNYLYGRNQINSNGEKSEYWNEIIDSKNGSRENNK